MLARLGFAFPLLSTPDILLIDEHLGAGDEKFQERVKSELDNYIGNVKTTIVASPHEICCDVFATKDV